MDLTTPPVRRQDPGDDRGATLATLSNTIVGLYKRYFGKGPTKARSYYVDDIVVCILRGGLTQAEITLTRNGRTDVVTRQRQEFHAAVRDEFAQAAESVLGRRVIAFMSATHTEPDVSAEVFVLEPEDRGR